MYHGEILASALSFSSVEVNTSRTKGSFTVFRCNQLFLESRTLKINGNAEENDIDQMKNTSRFFQSFELVAKYTHSVFKLSFLSCWYATLEHIFPYTIYYQLSFKFFRSHWSPAPTHSSLIVQSIAFSSLPSFIHLTTTHNLRRLLFSFIFQSLGKSVNLNISNAQDNF